MAGGCPPASHACAPTAKANQSPPVAGPRGGSGSCPWAVGRGGGRASTCPRTTLLCPQHPCLRSSYTPTGTLHTWHMPPPIHHAGAHRETHLHPPPTKCWGGGTDCCHGQWGGSLPLSLHGAPTPMPAQEAMALPGTGQSPPSLAPRQCGASVWGVELLYCGAQQGRKSSSKDGDTPWPPEARASRADWKGPGPDSHA